MVPQNSHQANNLLVPVAISASSVAYSSARIENMFMDLGSAAGVAVAQLVGRKNEDIKTGECTKFSVQEDINITQVQEILSEVYGQRFHGPLNDTSSLLPYEAEEY
jgi:hypothetical protein